MQAVDLSCGRANACITCRIAIVQRTAGLQSANQMQVTCTCRVHGQAWHMLSGMLIGEKNFYIPVVDNN